MLYNIALESINSAISRLGDGDVFARGRDVNRAYEAVDELNCALDHSVGASFTRRLSELYAYVQRELLKGHTQKSEQAFREALSVLKTLAVAWDQVVAQTCGGTPEAPRADGELDTTEPASRAMLEFSEPHAAYSLSGNDGVKSRDWSC